MEERRYVPAAGLDALLPAYDPIMRLLGFQRLVRSLIEQAQLQPRQQILDIGCGTGTLAVMIKRAQPDVIITGIDPDPKALARAQRKTERAGLTVRFDRGFADALPYPDASFDRVFSSMMLHHVRKDEKVNVLREVRRVLTPGGRLELLDFAGGTHNLLAQVLHGRQASASADARLLQRMREAGFADARRVATRGTIAGAVAYYEAVTAR